ncbi:MAG: glycosyltransferase family 4 protein [Aureispira sp.]|nr:glycosyltransferase family 4 protein [Aureispira sp.]
MPKPKTIFIFAYYSYKDPVFQSAVLPYFENFPNKDQFRFILLNFEQDQYRTSTAERTTIRQHLAQHNIIWYNTKWHSGRFKLIKKAFDFSWGLLLSLFLVIRYRAKAIYTEAFPGAIIGHILAKVTFRKHMVHTFEPHADYMVEAGEWSDTGWETKLLRSFERKVAKRCSHIFTATDGMIERIKEWGTNAQMHRVPSCVDLKTFEHQSQLGASLKKEHKIPESACVLVYLGKFGGYYWEEELFQLFAACERLDNQEFYYCIFTPEDHAGPIQYFEQYGIPKNKYLIKTLQKADVPAHLSMANIGISAVRPFPSKRFCSPIKNGEYWACGLPILTVKEVADDFIFAERHQLGIVMPDLTESSIFNAAKDIVNWYQQQNAVEVSQRCVDFVNKDRNVETYRKLYASIFEKL